MSMMVSFCAVLFPRDVLDELWDFIESVSEGFPTYSSTNSARLSNYTRQVQIGFSRLSNYSLRLLVTVYGRLNMDEGVLTS